MLDEFMQSEREMCLVERMCIYVYLTLISLKNCDYFM